MTIFLIASFVLSMYYIEHHMAMFDALRREQRMKRVFQFGLLAVLLVLPYLVTTTGTLLLIGVPANDVIVLRTDSTEYSFLRTLLSYKYFFTVCLILLILWIAFIIRLAWKLDFINKKRLYFWKSVPEYWTNYKGHRWRLIARLIIAVLVFGAGIFLYSSGFNLEKYPFIGSLSFFESFSGPKSTLAYMFPFCVPALPVIFSCATLAYVIVVPETLKDFRKMLVVPLVGILVIGTLYLLVIYAKNYIDFGKELKSMPGLTFKSESRQLLLLTDPPESGKLGDVFQDENSLQKGNVPFNEENEKVIKKYLRSKNFLTCLRGAGYSYISDNHMRELDPRGAAIINMNAFLKTGNSIQGFFLLNRIAVGPSVDGYYKLLTNISDESVISAKGKSALKLSLAYAKFGNLEKARYWYQEGIKTGDKVTDEDKKSYYPPAQPPFYGGRITGRFTRAGMPLAELHVGLIKAKSAELIRKQMKEKGEVGTLLELINLTDGVVSDKEGRFTFDRLGEGEYIILLSLKNEGNEKINVINSPGAISISKEKTMNDLGIIRLEPVR